MTKFQLNDPSLESQWRAIILFGKNSATSGQTVMHFHCHVVPRFKLDIDNPSGGMRHCVMHKGYY